jgi:ribosome-binding ATPase
VPDAALKSAFGERRFVVLSAKIEDELNSLDDTERKEFLKSVGLERSGLDTFIKTAYDTLGLITFLTTGETETRAWTIPRGSLAPRAGKAIHSDFEEKFIRAEVIAYEKLIEAGSYARARELGWLRTEGREYIVQDGDIIEFKI